MPEYVVSQTYRDDVLGIVRISVRSNLRNASARWSGNVLRLNLPPHTTLRQYNTIMDEWRPRLLELRPRTARYSHGQVFDFTDFTVSIAHATHRLAHVVSARKTDECNFIVTLSAEKDFSDPEVEQTISARMAAIARFMARKYLPEIASAEFRRIGVFPSALKISHGAQRLGYCSAKGEIALSYMIMFLPPPLRRYIICHEAAHLTEMNHSPRFHALADRYLDGMEKDLAKQLKKFAWPVLR